MPTQHHTPDPVRVARSRLARASVKSAGTSPEALDDARRNLAAAVIERTITERLASAPPLTTEQLDRLASLLRPKAGAHNG